MKSVLWAMALLILSGSAARAEDGVRAVELKPVMKADQVMLLSTREAGTVLKRVVNENGVFFEISLNDKPTKRVLLERAEFLKSVYNYEGHGFTNVKIGDIVLDATYEKRMAKVLRVYENGDALLENFYDRPAPPPAASGKTVYEHDAPLKPKIVPRAHFEKVVTEFPAADGIPGWRSGQQVILQTATTNAQVGYVTAVTERGSVRFNYSVPRAQPGAAGPENEVFRETRSVNELKRPSPIVYWEGFLDETPMPCIIGFRNLKK